MGKNTKLEKIDVAKIKYLIRLGELNLQQIANQFGVDGSMVSRIKSGKRWAEIEIDESGNLIEKEFLPIEKEFLPEDYTVIVSESYKEQERIEEESYIHRCLFVESYFIKKGKYYIQPATVESKRYIGGIWRSRSFLFDDFEDFIAHVALSVTEGVMKFKSNDADFNWQMVNAEGYKENRILHDYINKKIKTDIQEYANQINDVYKEQKNLEMTWVKPIIKSFDFVNETEEGSFSLSDEISSEMNLFHVDENRYSMNHFLQFFYENVNELNNDQNDFLKVMEFFQRDRNCQYTAPYRAIENKPYSERAKANHYKRIRQKMDALYKSEKKLTHIQMDAKRELKFWAGLVEIVESDENLNSQNEELSIWVSERMNFDYLDVVFEQMEQLEILEIVRSEMTNKTLYRVYALVVERVEQLKKVIRG